MLQFDELSVHFRNKKFLNNLIIVRIISSRISIIIFDYINSTKIQNKVLKYVH
jgi:YbbR domain-containing protein